MDLLGMTDRTAQLDVEKVSAGSDDTTTTVPPSSASARHDGIGRTISGSSGTSLSTSSSSATSSYGAQSLRPTPSRTLQRAQSTLSTIRSRQPIGTFSHPLTNTKTSADVIVDFDGPSDPYRPLNWSTRKKVMTTALYGFTTMGGTFASSVFSPGTNSVAAEFRISTTVATLPTALLIFGFGLGPLIWGPLSEVYGRKPAVLLPYFVAAIFSFATGAAKDTATIMLARFFTGFFASGAITNTGGVLSDIWAPAQRGVAIAGYAMAVVGGPTLGPIVGGAMIVSGVSWRWTQHLTGILMLAILTLDLLLLDESYPPVLLQRKARRLRFTSGNWALHARHEEWDVSLRALGHKYLIVPFKLLSTPICFLVALYASFVYGILYACLGAFPYVFERIRGWNALVGALPFLALLVGVVLGAAINVANQKYYARAMAGNAGRAVPEARLPPMMLGSLIFAAGLFVFAWTAGNVGVHWIVPVLGALLVGVGFVTIFQSALNYLIDTFAKNASSAIAANTFLRSVFGGAFPIFITPMLEVLGVGWGISVFAFFSVLLIPVPYLFYVFGKRIRARGEYSRESL